MMALLDALEGTATDGVSRGGRRVALGRSLAHRR
jgi:hypothetical protein